MNEVFGCWDAIRTIAAPPGLPLDLGEVKEQRSVSGTDNDAILSGLLRSAVARAETATRRALVTRTLEIDLPGFMVAGDDLLALPFPPLRKVVSVSYVDTGGSTQTLSASVYDVVKRDDDLGGIRLAYGQSWPATRYQPNAVTIRFIAGHVTPYTVSGDTLTASGHPFAAEDVTRLSQSGETHGDVPNGLALDTDYYVRDISGATLKLEASVGGGAITTTDGGTGTQYLGGVPEEILAGIHLTIGHWFENRETVVVGQVPMMIPEGAAALFASKQVWRF